jgi:RNA polymerase sigma-70 factor (ECF subfamily)
MVAIASSKSTVASVRPFPRARLGDSELVAEVRRGSPHALRAIWERYAEAVRATLYSSLGGDPAIDDLTQEVFVSFFRRAAQLRDPSALRSYLMGSAVRLAAVEKRSRARRRRRLEALASDPWGPGEQRPNVAGRDALRALRAILDNVSERPRMAFILRYVQDLTPPEVAVALGVSEATAKRAIARGRERVTLLASREPALQSYLGRLGRDSE